MKKMFYATLVSLSFISSLSYAGQSPAELKANWNKCVASDSSWYNRWGYWVVSFDKNESQKICNNWIYTGMQTRMTGCYIGGHWINAGWYCQDN